MSSVHSLFNSELTQPQSSFRKDLTQLQNPNATKVAAPQIKLTSSQFFSPQISSSHQKVESNFSIFSPLVRNRVLQSTASNMAKTLQQFGIGTNSPPTHFKQKDPQKDQSNEVKIRKLSNIQCTPPQTLPTFDQLSVLTSRLNDSKSTLPCVQGKEVSTVKNRLTNLEEKPSFFEEINKFSRKSFLTHSPLINQSIEQKSSPLIKKNDLLESLLEKQQIQSVQLPSIQQSADQKNSPCSPHQTFMHFKKGSCASIQATSQEFRQRSSSTMSREKNNSISQFIQSPYIAESPNSEKQTKNQVDTLHFLQKHINMNPLPPRRSLFKDEIPKFHNSLKNSPLNSPRNQNNENPQQTKESPNSPSSDSSKDSSFSSDMKTREIPKPQYLLTQRNATSKFFSPQLQSSSFKRRITEDFSQTKSQGIEFLRKFSNFRKDSGDKSDLNYSQVLMKEEENNQLLRELQYLSPNMKKFICDEVEQDTELKNNILQFCMINEMQEFSLYIGQFFDYIFEERKLIGTSCTFKFSPSLFSKIENLMIQFLNKEEKTANLLKMCKFQLNKNNYAVSQSLLLESLNGFLPLKNFSQSLSDLFFNSTLQSYVISYKQQEVTDQIYEFLSAALQNEDEKVAYLIEELKKLFQYQPSKTEYYMMKKIFFQFFKNNPLYSLVIRDQFFEVIEKYRYYFTSDEGFSAQYLKENKQSILKQIIKLWNQDKMLKDLKQIEMGSLSDFAQELYNFIFGEINCKQFEAKFNYYFIDQELNEKYANLLHKLVLNMAKNKKIQQQTIIGNISLLFEKLSWLLSKGDSFIELIGNYQDIEDIMLLKVTNQITKIDPSSGNKIRNEGNPYNLPQSERFQVSLLNEIPHFSEFLALYFNLNTTYHYSDLICFFNQQKKKISVFAYWADIIAESVEDMRRISKGKTDELEAYLINIFKSLHQ